MNDLPVTIDAYSLSTVGGPPEAHLDLVTDPQHIIVPDGSRTGTGGRRCRLEEIISELAQIAVAKPAPIIPFHFGRQVDFTELPPRFRPPNFLFLQCVDATPGKHPLPDGLRLLVGIGLLNLRRVACAQLRLQAPQQARIQRLRTRRLRNQDGASRNKKRDRQ